MFRRGAFTLEGILSEHFSWAATMGKAAAAQHVFGAEEIVATWTLQ